MRAPIRHHIGPFAGTFLLLICLWLGVTANAQPVRGDSTRPIRVAASVFTPYVYVNTNGDITGFSIELIRAIAAQSGRRVEFQIAPDPAHAIAMVEVGKADAVAVLIRSADRMRVFSFAPPFDTTEIVLEGLRSRAGELTGVPLTDLRIAARTGGFGASVLDKLGVTPILIQDLDAMLFALNRREIDLVAISKVQWDRTTGLFGTESDYAQIGPALASAEFGFAVDRNQPELLALLDAGLTRLQEDGTFTSLRRQWMGADPPFWTTGRLKAAFILFLGLILLIAFGSFARNRVRMRALALSEAQSREALAVAHARELELANAQLIRVNKQLSENHAEMERVLYAVTHDLKSPLVTARGFAGVLEEAASEGDVEGMLDASKRVLSSTAKFGVITDALLEYGRYQQSELVVRPIDVAHVLNNVRMMLQSEVERTGAIIELCHPVDPLIGDPAQILRVLLNLVGNALRYGCPEPGMRIEVSTEHRADGTVITVRDHGPGVPEEQRKLIFGLFRRYAKAHPDSTGLGLAIVEKIAKKHGGSAWVEDAPGGGAAFCVFIPNPETAVAAKYERRSS